MQKQAIVLALLVLASSLSACSSAQALPATPTPTAPLIVITKEFAGMSIGQAGIGRVSSLILDENPEPAWLNEISRQAFEYLGIGDPSLDQNRIEVLVFEMQGETGDIPFLLITIANTANLDIVDSIYVGFGEDENGVLVPPEDGQADIFLKLITIPREEGLSWVGVQDQNDPEAIYLPPLFVVNHTAEEISFNFPYAESFQEIVPVRGANAVFSRIIETPDVIPPEILDRLPEGYTAANGQLLDQSGVLVGEIVKGQDEGSFNLVFTTTDFNDQIQEHTVNLSFISIHKSGAVILDSGERTGFVWKGNEWANLLLDIQFQTDGTKFSEFPTVLYEDVASGALAEAERLEVQPLPEKAVPFSNYYISTSIGYGLNPQTTDEQRWIYLSDGETKPIRYEFFYNITLNNELCTLVTAQIKTSDDSFGLLHAITASKDYIQSNSKNLDWWYKRIDMQSKPLFILAIFDDPNIPCNQSDFDDHLKETVCPLNQPNSKILLPLANEMATTDIIPEKFEKVIFQLGSMNW